MLISKYNTAVLQPARKFQTNEKFEALAALYGWTISSYSSNREIAYLYREDYEGNRHPLLMLVHDSTDTQIAEFKYATERYVNA